MGLTTDGQRSYALTIFGDHEQRVIDQLQRCVAAEEGARGVLCTDGHLGYSQPGVFPGWFSSVRRRRGAGDPGTRDRVGEDGGSR